LADIVSGIPKNPENLFLCILINSELMPPRKEELLILSNQNSFLEF